MRFTILNSVVCEELTKKLSFRQRLKGDERVRHAGIWKENDAVKRKNKFLKGRSMSGMFKKHI